MFISGQTLYFYKSDSVKCSDLYSVWNILFISWQISSHKNCVFHTYPFASHCMKMSLTNR